MSTSVLYVQSELIEYRQTTLPPAEQFGHRLLVKCLQLKFVLQSFSLLTTYMSEVVAFLLT